MNESESARSFDPLVGVQLGGYVIEGLLGKGAMGAVYRARQVSLNRAVALKVMISSLAQREDLVARFRREAHAAGALNHPNIVQVHDFGETEGMCFYVMELIDGLSLGEYLKRGERFSERELIEVGRELTLALQAAHEAGVIHRDIKPDNLMLTSRGMVKLADLGLARVHDLDSDVSLTLTGMSMGTPLYMAPEQAQGEKTVDHRADFYSLGATLFHLATGRPPFEGQTAGAVLGRQLTGQVPHARALNPSLGQGFSDTLRWLMAPNPAGRPNSHAEILSALEQCHTDALRREQSGSSRITSSSVAPAPKVEVFVKPMRLWPLWAACGGAFAAIAVAGFLITHKPVVPEAAQVLGMSETNATAEQAEHAEGAVSERSRVRENAGSGVSITEGTQKVAGDSTGPAGATVAVALQSGAMTAGQAPRLPAEGNAAPALATPAPALPAEMPSAKAPAAPLETGSSSPQSPPTNQTLARSATTPEAPQPSSRIPQPSNTGPFSADEFKELDAILSPLREAKASGEKAASDRIARFVKELDEIEKKVAGRSDLDGVMKLRTEREAWAVGERPPKPDAAAKMPAEYSNPRYFLDRDLGLIEGRAASAMKSETSKALSGLRMFEAKLTRATRIEAALAVREITAKVEKGEMPEAMRTAENAEHAEAGPAGLNTKDAKGARADDSGRSRVRENADGAGTPAGQTLAGSATTLASATIFSATKSRPFVNSLGMPFVPIKGAKVLFCIWETRVKDFDAFVKDSGYSWSQKPGFEQTPEDPVVYVSWDDANAFCAWLSKKEGKEYRLPTDEEWDAAVGKEKYPWGKDWSPPKKVENIAGEESKLGDSADPTAVLAGYKDDHPRTAPVGSYKATKSGLYDMGGNVREWVQDWCTEALYKKHKDGGGYELKPEQIADIKKGNTCRVLRGGYWLISSSGTLVSSSRTPALSGARYGNIGFRCVLVASSP